MRHSVWLCAVVALAISGCRTSPTGVGSPTLNPGFQCSDPILKLDRGDWMVNQGSRVWKVMAASAANRPPRHLGYVVERQYRQMRGGPEFLMQSVTTLDRKEQIGHIDQLGKGVRYEPQRDGTFREVSVGTNTRELNVGAIFGTTDRITLVRTSERRLAFEALDVDGDGLLQPAETASFGDRVSGADTNGDGVVDFQEFNVVDVL